MLRLRNWLKMAEETAAKKLKTSPPLIGTHKYAVSFRCVLNSHHLTASSS